MENQENEIHYANVKHTVNKIEHKLMTKASSKCMIFSPTRQIFSNKGSKVVETVEGCGHVNEKVEESVLICAKFQNALWLEFGNVKINTINKIDFKLVNPSTTKSVVIDLEYSNDNKAGLSVTLGSVYSNSVEIPPNEGTFGTVQWNPTQNGPIREVVKLKMDKKAPLQLTVHGSVALDKVSRPSSLILGEIYTINSPTNYLGRHLEYYNAIS